MPVGESAEGCGQRSLYSYRREGGESGASGFPPLRQAARQRRPAVSLHRKSRAALSQEQRPGHVSHHGVGSRDRGAGLEIFPRHQFSRFGECRIQARFARQQTKDHRMQSPFYRGARVVGQMRHGYFPGDLQPSHRLAGAASQFLQAGHDVVVSLSRFHGLQRTKAFE